MRERDLDKLSRAVRRVVVEREEERKKSDPTTRNRRLYALELKHFTADPARLDRLIEDIAEYHERMTNAKTTNESAVILDELVEKRFPKADE